MRLIGRKKRLETGALLLLLVLKKFVVFCIVC